MNEFYVVVKVKSNEDQEKIAAMTIGRIYQADGVANADGWVASAALVKHIEAERPKDDHA